MHKKTLLYTLTFLCSYLSLAAQRLDDSRMDQVQAITLQNDSTITKTYAFLEDISVEHDLSLTYTAYYREQLNKTQGSHLGHLLHGKYQHFTRQMQLLEEGAFEQGLPVGLWKYWLDGQLRETAHYKNGQLHGERKLYDAEGALLEVAAYKNGLRQGTTTIYEDGEITSQVNYRKGVVRTPRRAKVTLDSTAIDTLAANNDAAPEVPIPQTTTRRTPNPTRQPASNEQRRNNTNVRQVRSDNNSNTTVPNTSGLNRKARLFITDQQTGLGLADVSIKVSSFERLDEEGDFQFFTYTGEDGYCQFDSKGNNYILFITHRGYQTRQVRIEQQRWQESYMINLAPTPSCGTIAGTVQPAAKNMAVSGATINVKDNQGRIIKTTYTDRQGDFNVCVPCNMRYLLIVESEGYLASREQVYLNNNCTQATEDIVVYLQNATARPSPDLPTTRPNTITVDAPVNDAPDNNDTTPPLNSSPPAYRTVSADQASFFVIAGTFSNRRNAEQRLSEVKEAGFTQAKIVRLSDSGYYAVNLGALDSRSAADALHQQFESKTQLSAYVRDTPF